MVMSHCASLQPHIKLHLPKVPQFRYEETLEMLSWASLGPQHPHWGRARLFLNRSQPAGCNQTSFLHPCYFQVLSRDSKWPETFHLEEKNKRRRVTVRNKSIALWQHSGPSISITHTEIHGLEGAIISDLYFKAVNKGSEWSYRSVMNADIWLGYSNLISLACTLHSDDATPSTSLMIALSLLQQQGPPPHWS